MKLLRFLLVLLALLATKVWAAPAEFSKGISATVIELSSNSVVISATKPASTISITNGYFKRISATSFAGDGSGLTGVGSAITSPRLLAVSNATPFDTAGLTVNGTISGSSLISTSLNGVVSGTYGHYRFISATALAGGGAGLSGVNAATAGAVSWSNIVSRPPVLDNISNSTGSVTVTTVSATLNYATTTSGTYHYGQYASYTTVTAGNIAAARLDLTNISATANIQANKFIGDGSGLTGISGTAPTSVSWSIITGVPTVLQNISNSTGTVTVTTVNANTISSTSGGSVSATYGNFRYISGTSIYGTFSGDGSGLTGVPGGGGSATWAGLPDKPLVLQNISNSIGSVTATSFAGNVSGTQIYALNVSSTNLYVPGNAQFTSGLIKVGTGTIYDNGVQSLGTYSTIANGTIDWRPNGSTNMYLTGSDLVMTGAAYIGANSQASGGSKLEVAGTASATAFVSPLVSSTSGGTVSATYGYFRYISATSGLGGSPSWYTVTNIPSRVQAISGGTPIDLTGLTVTGTISGATLISTTANGIVSASIGNFSNISASTAVIVGIGAFNLNASGPVTTGSISDSGVLNVGGAISGSLTLFSGGLITANAGVNANGTVTATTLNAALISTTSGGTVSGSVGNFRNISGTAATVNSLVVGSGGCTGCGGGGSSAVGGTGAVQVASGTGVYGDQGLTYSSTTQILSALNVSFTNVYLNSPTLVSGQLNFVRDNGDGIKRMDGSAGCQYDWRTNRLICSETDLPASQSPSATLQVSGTLLVTSKTTLANVSATGNIQAVKFLGDGAGLTGVVASASPAGNDKALQVNNNGVTSGYDNAQYISSTNTLNITGTTSTTTVREGLVTVDSSFSPTLVNFALGSYLRTKLSVSSTISFTSIPTSMAGYVVHDILISGTGITLNYPPNARFDGNVSPTLTLTNGTISKLTYSLISGTTGGIQNVLVTGVATAVSP